MMRTNRMIRFFGGPADGVTAQPMELVLTQEGLIPVRVLLPHHEECAWYATEPEIIEKDGARRVTYARTERIR